MLIGNNRTSLRPAPECCLTTTFMQVDVALSLDAKQYAVQIVAEVQCVGQTGVEMEALTAVSVAALTVFDMCKAASHTITIEDVQLDSKSGGRSGKFSRASFQTTNVHRKVGGTPTMQ